MPELLKAARILRREVGDEVLVVGCVLGPMTVATQLLGIEVALYLAIDEPESFARLLDFAAEVVIRFGVAQVEAGAHLPVVFDPSASPAVIPHQFFREFDLPRLKRVFAAFKQAGAAANWLHIAGPTEPILPLYPQAGVDIANFDYCVNPLDAQRALPQTCLDGNIKPLSFVEGTPEEIAVKSSRLQKLFADRGGFILSSGCEIPPESQPENVAAMVSAVRERW
jgi:uroporphyrinogen decarboxylase